MAVAMRSTVRLSTGPPSVAASTVSVSSRSKQPRVTRPRPRSFHNAVIASGATAALYVGTESLAVALVGVFLGGIDGALFYIPAQTRLQR